MMSTFYWLQAEEGGGPAGGSGRRAAEEEEVVGGGQENTGLPLLPLRQRSAPCSHLPVRALLWAASQNDGQLLLDRGERIEGNGSFVRRYPRFLFVCVGKTQRCLQPGLLQSHSTHRPWDAPIASLQIIPLPVAETSVAHVCTWQERAQLTEIWIH